jgi:hypothetical protein
MRFQLLLKTFSSLKKLKLFDIIARTLCAYGDAQGCKIYTPMLWYDRIKISNSVLVMLFLAWLDLRTKIKTTKSHMTDQQVANAIKMRVIPT